MVRFKGAVDRKQWFLIPCVGVINERFYYGYKVFSIAFAWLIWRFKICFGIKKVVKDV